MSELLEISHLHQADSSELLEMADFAMQVEESIFPVHTQVLSASSGVFRRLLFDMQHPLATTDSNQIEPSAANRSRTSNNGYLNLPRLKLTDVTPAEFAFLLRYLYTNDYMLFEKIEHAKLLVDLAQRFDIPAIIRNCVPWVSRSCVEFVMNAQAPHHDAIYWLNLAEVWQLRQLQVACMAAIADEIAFYSAGEGYWSGFDSSKVQQLRPHTLFIIARAVAEVCSRQITNKEVRGRIQDLENIISCIMQREQEEEEQRQAAAAVKQATATGPACPRT
eukprot:CAMPEP_0202910680 /NCGR_PEP_ID=MMETSP1392-20130828/52687_1 /ASSEMBLY_ACC=CAM_ASM_000868 /TAXON_ID=225041 /ORGANISM="Chlamydomonas chlamydogama, Strain SAG 11-48b" /LENGTH=276 /DNA_ID=CAMNT_0049600853 /DNA_START=262 /DNA_END=1092 /DNA_ORIENTATION=+